METPLKRCTRGKVLHQDHYVPLSSPLCEGTTPTNILPACQTCNQSKSDMQPEAWLIRHFGKRRAKVILARVRAYFDAVRQQEN